MSNTLVSGGEDGNARLWSFEGGKLQRTAILPHMRSNGLNSQSEYSALKAIFWNVRLHTTQTLGRRYAYYHCRH